MIRVVHRNAILHYRRYIHVVAVSNNNIFTENARNFSKITSSTASDDTFSSTTATEKTISEENTEKKQIPIFPWRCSEEIPPRFNEDSNEYNPYGPVFWMEETWYKRIFLHILSARALGKSIYETLTFSWESEMCQNFAWAFGRAVAGLLSFRYNVPIDNMEKYTNNDQSIEIKFDSNVNSADSGDDENEELARKMLEPKLLELYSSNSQQEQPKSTNYQIRLQTTPIACKILNLNFILFTREMVQKMPILHGLYTRFVATSYQNPGVPNDAGRKLLDSIQNQNQLQITIIAQVLVHCKEIFWVKDEHGNVIQGEEAGDLAKDALHVVRFEMPVEFPSLNAAKPTSWVISDWDDLVNGNVFY